MRLLPPICCWLMLAMLAMRPPPAHAHAGLPETSNITVRRGHPQDLFAGATFGAAVSRDSGKTWRWICPEAMAYGSYPPDSFLWQPNGDLLAVTGTLLIRSRDGGCTWQAHPAFAPRVQWPIGLASPASTPSRVWVVTERSTAPAPNGLFRSDDGGETFTLTSLQRADAHFTAVKVAPSDPRRLYVSAGVGTPPVPRIYRSADEGQSWEELTPVLPSFERPPYDLFVLRVSETQPDHLWARVSAIQNSDPSGAYTYLLESKDGGRTFQSLIKMDEYLVGMEASADGRTVWAATPSRFFRAQEGMPVALLALPSGNACVERQGDALLVCGSTWVHDWALARTSNGGDSYEPLFSLPDIQPPACPAGTPVHDICRPRWPQFAPSIGANPALPPEEGQGDGGTPGPGGPDAGSPPDEEPPPRPGGCGCSSPGGLVPAACLLALALFRRSRRNPETR